MPIILRLTTHVCHAKEKVAFAGWTPVEPDNTPLFDVKNGPYIPIAAHVFPMKRKALTRLREVEEYAETSPLNRIINHGHEKRGIITMGLPFLSLMDVLEEAEKKPDVLCLGIVYPLPRDMVKAFLAAHEEVRVLEELDDVLELEIKALAYDAGLKTIITGKRTLEDWVGEYAPNKVYDLMKRDWPDMTPDRPIAARTDTGPPERPPQLCPGCGHRSAFHAIKKALKNEDITVADIGCHTLGFQPPYRMGELLMSMGASLGMAAGLSLFNDSRNVVAFLGDSTFFHAGLPGIINAVFNKHNMTLILMENGATAMTGHQDHPASGKNFNETTEKIPVRQVLEGLGVERIYEVDTYQQAKLTELVKQAVAGNGFSAVIAKHPCMLKFTREQRRKASYQSMKVKIDQDKCRRIHECVEEFGCPSFQLMDDGKVVVNPDLCIGDGSCRQTCPAKAIEMPKAAE